MERTIDVKPAANQLPSIETVPAKPTPVRKPLGWNRPSTVKTALKPCGVL